MHSIEDLLTLMNQLRDTETGCPWDKEQTFETIAAHTLEEAYEVVDAIEKRDMQALREELGDLLLQVVFHSQIAKEQQLFTFEDVVNTLQEKLVNRHPHLFGGEKITTAREQSAAWEKIKLEEKRQAGNAINPDILHGVPVALPGLTRALKLQKKAERAGFDWPTIKLAFDKLDEEIQELLYVIDNNGSKDQLQEEVGDMLFCCVNLARKLEVDPETAVRGCNRKFENRIKYIQNQLDVQGLNINHASFQELNDLWDQAKMTEGRE